MKVFNTVKRKEWTGNAMGKRKRMWEEEGDTQEALDRRSMEQELENVPNGGGHHLTRPKNGGKIQKWEGATQRGTKKRKIQLNKITNYFGNPLGLVDDDLGAKGRVLKLEDSNLTLSVKPNRPPNIIVFEKGFFNKI